MLSYSWVILAACFVFSNAALASAREGDANAAEAGCSSGRVQACTRLLVAAIKDASYASASIQVSGQADTTIAGNTAIQNANAGSAGMLGAANTADIAAQGQQTAANVNLVNSTQLERSLKLARGTYNSQCGSGNAATAAICSQLKQACAAANKALGKEESAALLNLSGAQALSAAAISGGQNAQELGTVSDGALEEQQVAAGGHRIFQTPDGGQFTIPILPFGHRDYLTVPDVISGSPSGTRCISNCR